MSDDAGPPSKPRGSAPLSPMQLRHNEVANAANTIGEALSDKLDAVFGEAQLVCPVCKNEEWTRGPVVGPSIHVLGNNPVGRFGVAQASYPLATLVCTRCTNVLFFPAGGLGLKKAADEK